MLEQFMNENPNWRTLLAQPPYSLEIRDDPPYTILKYNMMFSDLSNPMVREARGYITRLHHNGFVCVAHALDKFGNYGESYADTAAIDWENGVDVQEKIDGSLIKMWWDLGEWHVSTNGTIDAWKATCGDSTFGSIFRDVVCEGGTWENFLKQLNPSYCYYFELVAPLYNHIVVHYVENRVYFLGCRDMRTHEESDNIGMLNWPTMHYPRHFIYHSLAECIEAAHHMGVDEEGYVVKSREKKYGSFLRIKVKGDEYLRLHRMRGNGPFTVTRAIEMWKNDTLDDFVAYYPEFKDFVEKVMHNIRMLVEEAEAAYKSAISFSNSKKEFALALAKIHPIIPPYCFMRYDNRVDSAFHFYKNMYREKNIAMWVSQNMGQKEIGVNEDE